MADEYWKGRDAHRDHGFIYEHNHPRHSREAREFEDGFRAAEREAEERREEEAAHVRRINEQRRIENERETEEEYADREQEEAEELPQ